MDSPAPTALSSGPISSPLLATLTGRPAARPPVWLMRQAGRYLPEYREIRGSVPTFLDFCYNPRLAAEATIQPIRRFGFDAAILFSDILVVPDALGQDVTFEAGHGPRLTPIATRADLDGLRPDLDMARLAPVLETVQRVRGTLGPETALIGFCGAPWTVASYMVAGRGTPDQAPARLCAYRDPDLFQGIVDRLVAASITYLSAQIEAGVDAVQIFDSWAGVLPTLEYERWCAAPVRAIVAGVRRAHPAAKIIGFPRANGHQLLDAAGWNLSALGLDTSIDLAWVREALPPALPLQGNLDPLALLAGGDRLDQAVDHILATLEGRPHIFNLGHGILPETPIAHVERLIRRIRAT